MWGERYGLRFLARPLHELYAFAARFTDPLWHPVGHPGKECVLLFRGMHRNASVSQVPPQDDQVLSHFLMHSAVVLYLFALCIMDQIISICVGSVGGSARLPRMEIGHRSNGSHI